MNSGTMQQQQRGPSSPDGFGQPDGLAQASRPEHLAANSDLATSDEAHSVAIAEALEGPDTRPALDRTLSKDQIAENGDVIIELSNERSEPSGRWASLRAKARHVKNRTMNRVHAAGRLDLGGVISPEKQRTKQLLGYVTLGRAGMLVAQLGAGYLAHKGIIPIPHLGGSGGGGSHDVELAGFAGGGSGRHSNIDTADLHFGHSGGSSHGSNLDAPDIHFAHSRGHGLASLLDEPTTTTTAPAGGTPSSHEGLGEIFGNGVESIGKGGGNHAGEPPVGESQGANERLAEIFGDAVEKINKYDDKGSRHTPSGEADLPTPEADNHTVTFSIDAPYGPGGATGRMRGTFEEALARELVNNHGWTPEDTHSDAFNTLMGDIAHKNGMRIHGWGEEAGHGQTLDINQQQGAEFHASKADIDNVHHLIHPDAPTGSGASSNVPAGEHTTPGTSTPAPSPSQTGDSIPSNDTAPRTGNTLPDHGSGEHQTPMPGSPDTTTHDSQPDSTLPRQGSGDHPGSTLPDESTSTTNTTRPNGSTPFPDTTEASGDVGQDTTTTEAGGSTSIAPEDTTTTAPQIGESGDNGLGFGEYMTAGILAASGIGLGAAGLAVRGRRNRNRQQNQTGRPTPGPASGPQPQPQPQPTLPPGPNNPPQPTPNNPHPGPSTPNNPTPARPSQMPTGRSSIQTYVRGKPVSPSNPLPSNIKPAAPTNPNGIAPSPRRRGPGRVRPTITRTTAIQRLTPNTAPSPSIDEYRQIPPALENAVGQRTVQLADEYANATGASRDQTPLGRVLNNVGPIIDQALGFGGFTRLDNPAPVRLDTNALDAMLRRHEQYVARNPGAQAATKTGLAPGTWIPLGTVQDAEGQAQVWWRIYPDGTDTFFIDHPGPGTPTNNP